MVLHGKTVTQMAQLVLTCTDLNANVDFFKDLGFQLESISPADNPQLAMLGVPGLSVCLTVGEESANGTTIRMPSDKKSEPRRVTVAPNGTRFLFFDPNADSQLPEIKQSYVLSSPSTDAGAEQWIRGRAGMLYRDLIPGRQNERFIASQIKITDGGNIEDYPHFHNVRFQMIFCYKGWVRLVYEDQGGEFILNAGDCVLQPPTIRHQVLASSDGLEVIEIGCPANHDTFADNDIRLPTSLLKPEREFSGQQFVRFQRDEATWLPWRLDGYESAEFGFLIATAGMASASIVRTSAGVSNNPVKVISHDEEFLFFFVLAGVISIACGGQGVTLMNAGDSCVIPAQSAHALLAPSDSLELLEVRLSGEFSKVSETMSYQELLDIL